VAAPGRLVWGVQLRADRARADALPLPLPPAIGPVDLAADARTLLTLIRSSSSSSSSDCCYETAAAASRVFVSSPSGVAEIHPSPAASTTAAAAAAAAASADEGAEAPLTVTVNAAALNVSFLDAAAYALVGTASDAAEATSAAAPSLTAASTIPLHLSTFPFHLLLAPTRDGLALLSQLTYLPGPGAGPQRTAAGLRPGFPSHAAAAVSAGSSGPAAAAASLRARYAELVGVPAAVAAAAVGAALAARSGAGDDAACCYNASGADAGAGAGVGAGRALLLLQSALRVQSPWADPRWLPPALLSTAHPAVAAAVHDLAPSLPPAAADAAAGAAALNPDAGTGASAAESGGYKSDAWSEWYISLHRRFKTERAAAAAAAAAGTGADADAAADTDAAGDDADFQPAFLGPRDATGATVRRVLAAPPLSMAFEQLMWESGQVRTSVAAEPLVGSALGDWLGYTDADGDADADDDTDVDADADADTGNGNGDETADMAERELEVKPQVSDAKPPLPGCFSPDLLLVYQGWKAAVSATARVAAAAALLRLRRGDYNPALVSVGDNGEGTRERADAPEAAHVPVHTASPVAVPLSWNRLRSTLAHLFHSQAAAYSSFLVRAARHQTVIGVLTPHSSSTGGSAGVSVGAGAGIAMGDGSDAGINPGTDAGAGTGSSSGSDAWARYASPTTVRAFLSLAPSALCRLTLSDPAPAAAATALAAGSVAVSRRSQADLADTDADVSAGAGAGGGAGEAADNETLPGAWFSLPLGPALLAAAFPAPGAHRAVASDDDDDDDGGGDNSDGVDGVDDSAPQARDRRRSHGLDAAGRAAVLRDRVAAVLAEPVATAAATLLPVGCAIGFAFAVACLHSDALVAVSASPALFTATATLSTEAQAARPLLGVERWFRRLRRSAITAPAADVATVSVRTASVPPAARSASALVAAVQWARPALFSARMVARACADLCASVLASSTAAEDSRALGWLIARHASGHAGSDFDRDRALAEMLAGPGNEGSVTALTIATGGDGSAGLSLSQSLTSPGSDASGRRTPALLSPGAGRALSNLIQPGVEVPHRVRNTQLHNSRSNSWRRLKKLKSHLERSSGTAGVGAWAGPEWQLLSDLQLQQLDRLRAWEAGARARAAAAAELGEWAEDDSEAVAALERELLEPEHSSDDDDGDDNDGGNARNGGSGSASASIGADTNAGARSLGIGFISSKLIGELLEQLEAAADAAPAGAAARFGGGGGAMPPPARAWLHSISDSRSDGGTDAGFASGECHVSVAALASVPSNALVLLPPLPRGVLTPTVAAAVAAATGTGAGLGLAAFAPGLRWGALPHSSSDAASAAAAVAVAAGAAAAGRNTPVLPLPLFATVQAALVAADVSLGNVAGAAAALCAAAAAAATAVHATAAGSNGAPGGGRLAALAALTGADCLTMGLAAAARAGVSGLGHTGTDTCGAGSGAGAGAGAGLGAGAESSGRLGLNATGSTLAAGIYTPWRTLTVGRATNSDGSVSSVTVSSVLAQPPLLLSLALLPAALAARERLWTVAVAAAAARTGVLDGVYDAWQHRLQAAATSSYPADGSAGADAGAGTGAFVGAFACDMTDYLLRPSSAGGSVSALAPLSVALRGLRELARQRQCPAALAAALAAGRGDGIPRPLPPAPLFVVADASFARERAALAAALRLLLRGGGGAAHGRARRGADVAVAALGPSVCAREWLVRPRLLLSNTPAGDSIAPAAGAGANDAAATASAARARVYEWQVESFAPRYWPRGIATASAQLTVHSDDTDALPAIAAPTAVAAAAEAEATLARARGRRPVSAAASAAAAQVLSQRVSEASLLRCSVTGAVAGLWADGVGVTAALLDGEADEEAAEWRSHVRGAVRSVVRGAVAECVCCLQPRLSFALSAAAGAAPAAVAGSRIDTPAGVAVVAATPAGAAAAGAAGGAVPVKLEPGVAHAATMTGAGAGASVAHAGTGAVLSSIGDAVEEALGAANWCALCGAATR
jgi:hypothetical protein